MSDDANDGPLERSIWKHPIAILLGTILVGAIGSGLWDICAKPVLFGSARFMLDLVTFGSTAVKDSAYADAALDQTAMMSSQLYLNATSILCMPFLFMLALEFGLTPRRIRGLLAGPVSPPDRLNECTLEERLARLERSGVLTDAQRHRLRRIRRTLIVMMGLTLGYLITSTMIKVQSLQIWRTFHADLRMCAPYMDSEQEELLLSKYTTIKSKADFGSVIDELQVVATAHGLILHSNNLW
ncbi:MAG: hypothetical protein U0936_28365 [Planctomycetaceae bacterium]